MGGDFTILTRKSGGPHIRTCHNKMFTKLTVVVFSIFAVRSKDLETTIQHDANACARYMIYTSTEVLYHVVFSPFFCLKGIYRPVAAQSLARQQIQQQILQQQLEHHLTHLQLHLHLKKYIRPHAMSYSRYYSSGKL